MLTSFIQSTNHLAMITMYCLKHLKTVAKVILLISLVFLPEFSICQTTDTGSPMSWDYRLDESGLPAISLPAIDQSQMSLEEDDPFKIGPWRFGIERDVKINVKQQGQAEDIPGQGKIFRLKLQSPGALSINLILSDFFLPNRSTLHIFSPDHRQVLGAYTSINNNSANLLGTELVHGDQIILEYFEPNAYKGQGKLTVGVVVHGYRSIAAYGDRLLKAYFSGDCNHDVLCPAGSGWEAQISSVGIILLGGTLCSGALINNTLRDQTPYFLTAAHCFSFTDPSTWVVRFNWESPVARCASVTPSVDPGPPYDQSMNGVTPVAIDPFLNSTDFFLLQINGLNANLASEWNLYFAGWDRSGNVPTEVTGIHHPQGDVKKICRDFQGAILDNSMFFFDGYYWLVANWDIGVTEGGSSGSPLFDQNKRIIGQLTGGLAACVGTNDNDIFDLYGRLEVAWDHGEMNIYRLRDWLDPIGSGVMTLDGMYASPDPIPTLSEWGCALLGLLLGICFTVSYKQRSILSIGQR